jgi:hypothetical protein
MIVESWVYLLASPVFGVARMSIAGGIPTSPGDGLRSEGRPGTGLGARVAPGDGLVRSPVFGTARARWICLLASPVFGAAHKASLVACRRRPGTGLGARVARGRAWEQGAPEDGIGSRGRPRTGLGARHARASRWVCLLVSPVFGAARMSIAGGMPTSPGDGLRSIERGER